MAGGNLGRFRGRVVPGRGAPSNRCHGRGTADNHGRGHEEGQGRGPGNCGGRPRLELLVVGVPHLLVQQVLVAVVEVAGILNLRPVLRIIGRTA
jgi:hypothetical protein